MIRRLARFISSILSVFSAACDLMVCPEAQLIFLDMTDSLVEGGARVGFVYVRGTLQRQKFQRIE